MRCARAWTHALTARNWARFAPSPSGDDSSCGLSIRQVVVRRPSTPTNKETAMRFMMIVKPPAYNGQPDPKEMAAMGRYNDELRRAGVLLDLNGLEPTEKGAKVKSNGTKRTVID